MPGLAVLGDGLAVVGNRSGSFFVLLFFGPMSAPASVSSSFGGQSPVQIAAITNRGIGRLPVIVVTAAAEMPRITDPLSNV